MVFCRFEAEYDDIEVTEETEAEKNADGKPRRRRPVVSRSGLWRDVEDYNERFDGKAYFFPVDYIGEAVRGAAVADCFETVKANLAGFMDYFYLKLVETTVLEEVTFNTFVDLAESAERDRYIKRGMKFMEDMGICNVYNEVRRITFNYGEELVERKEKEKLAKRIEGTLYSDTMLPELDRIFAGSGKKGTYGHPCHYFIESAQESESRDVTCKTLLSALYTAGRLSSCRYWFIDADPSDRITRTAIEKIYETAKGASVVIRISPFNDTEDGEYASANRNMVDLFSKMIQKYQNDTLTVVCLPAGNPRVKSMFYDELGSVNMVECREDRASGERAKHYLKMLCDEKNVKPDKNLYARLGEDTGYMSEELVLLFNEWYNKKLRTTIYPQYRDLERAEIVAVRNRETGTALARLNELVGLDSAKEVIRKAIDYFTAQKLFKEKGFKVDRPNLSMVFTGNPGSCKTTVARLVAEIFRDTGILSMGRMVECGRADLVAKFVGWTAQNIKKKFLQARGSVLFIDEAYSLVDDRDGSFGDEAINTIVQEMENHRDDVLVIFAGYPDKMENFLNKNPGLRSRISFHVKFEDYNADELCDISSLIARQKGLVISGAAMEKLHGVFEKISRQNDFGNGRAARNVIEAAKMSMASRLVRCDTDSLTDRDFTTILPEDIAEPEIKPAAVRRVVGF